MQALQDALAASQQALQNAPSNRHGQQSGRQTPEASGSIDDVPDSGSLQIFVQQQNPPQQHACVHVDAVLHSGEDALTVLGELAEDVEQYDVHVYRRRSPLERMGHQGQGMMG